VTVTYKAKDAVSDEEASAENVEESEEVESEEEGRDASDEEQQIEEEDDDDSVVPTPSSLPSELARAFDFHKNKHPSEGRCSFRESDPGSCSKIPFLGNYFLGFFINSPRNGSVAICSSSSPLFLRLSF